MSTTKIQEEIDKFLRVALHGHLPDNIEVHQISDYAAEIGLYPYAKRSLRTLKALPLKAEADWYIFL
ncbi:hypothetical protein [Pricia antarctica]|nr:hypothetical protein [Pricia antarctica]